MSSTNISSSGKSNKEIKSRFHNLKIDTSTTSGDNQDGTPATSTSNSSDQFNYTPNNIRGSRDVRSPGEKASPLNVTAPAPTNPTTLAAPNKGPQEDTTPIPDFITQTDQYGNPTTPRNDPQISSNTNHNNAAGDMDAHNHDSEHHDPCEALLESFRMMCCCLLYEDKNSGITSPSNSNNYPNKNTHTKSHMGIGRTRLIKNARRYRQRTSAPNQNQTSMLLPMDPNDPNRVKLLPKIHPQDEGKKCLVLDLDETLVHSSFRAVPGADFVIPVQIEDVVHFVYVAKRPGVDNFLIEMAKHYEIVVYTASLNKYADPLLDLLDPHRVIRTRLFRESCVYFEGNYVKDMSLIDRELSQSIIVDNSPNSYLFHPDNAIDCSSFIDDPNDRELIQIGGFLKNIKDAEDVRGICQLWKQWPGKT